MVEIFTIVWFFLPTSAANATASLSRSIPILRRINYPMDLGFKLGGIRLFGENKTFRGLILGTFVGIVVIFLQAFLYDKVSFLQSNLSLNYSELNLIVIGILQGSGALIGDAVESFFKRRVGIKPGGEWKPFDQIDFITATVILTLPFVQFAWYAYVVLYAIFIFGHKTSNILAYKLGIKDVPY